MCARASSFCCALVPTRSEIGGTVKQVPIECTGRNYTFSRRIMPFIRAREGQN